MRLSVNNQILIAVSLSIVFGIYVHQLPTDLPQRITILGICDLLGGIFINLLKMILLPLIFTSIATGIANLQAHHQMKSVWRYTLIYFLATPAIASAIGLTAVNLFKPGVGLNQALFQESMTHFSAEHMTLAEFLKKFLAELFLNPVTAMSEGKIFPTVVFAVFLGIALVTLRERAATVLRLLNELYEVFMRIIEWIIKVAPVGIAALLIKLIATQDLGLLNALGKFMAVVIGTTLFHGIIVLPTLLYIFGGMSPLKFFNGMKESLLTAFSTSSSSATLPVTLQCVEKNLGVDKNIVGFVAPLGATLNMDGTALYEAIAAIFVANLTGMHLNLGAQIVVFLSAIVASIGAPGIPSAGMVTMVMVLQSVSLPTEAIAILLPIDRILDTVRTVVNVQGDAICSVIVQRHID